MTGGEMSMATETSVSFGAFRLDRQNACVWRDTEMIKLTPKAFAVLSYLIEHPGRIVTKEELFTVVWPETVVSDVALSVCVREIRKSLEDEVKTPQYIETVHRRGFRFIGKVVSNQWSVISQEEENQRAKIEDPAQESEESRSLEAAQRNPGKENGQAEGVRLEAEGRPPSSPFSLQPEAYSLAQDSALNTQDLPPVSPTSSWYRRSLVLTAVLLVIVTVWIVQYLSRSALSPQNLALKTETAPQSLPLPDKPSIIVLPFVNMSGDPSQEYFSDGVTEEITATLSRVAGLFVIARTSAFTYKGKAAKVQDISREMGVRYVLEGSVQKADGQVRIIAQLIEAATGEHVWAEHYDRPLKDIFALHDEIRQKIALALRVQLTIAEPVQSQSVPTTNLEAYDFYLRGLEAVLRASYKNDPLTPARQLYETAIALDSQYAEAYARLGETYLLDWFFNPSSNQGQSLERALDMEQRAIALNEALPLPHAILGTVFAWKRQYEQALVEARQAVTLDPNFAEGYFHLGTVLFFAGPPDESVKAYEQAVRLNPRHPDIHLFNLAASYRIARRYQEALALGKQFAARHPDYPPVHAHLAVCYAELDQLVEARAEGAEILRLNPTFTLAGFERFWPVKDPAVMERHLAALRKAGLK
jgi:TolB-like protein/DNA-binding winged helix-turn-helix (wHTH) protein/Flp pilus assembly protein TadD